MVEVAAAAAATCWQGSDCRNNAHKVMNILNTKSEEHLGAQVPHQDEEAGSIVFPSSSNASEIKNEERRSTPEEEKPRLKELSKCIEKYTREKRMKRQQDIQRILEDFKGGRNIPGIKSAKKKVLIT